MRKIIAVLLTAAGMSAAMAQNGGSLFKDSELTISPFGSYVNSPGGKWGGGVSLDYFFMRYLGLGAVTHWENSTHFFDNVAAEGMIRIPIGSLPIAPYGIGTVGYDFFNQNWFESLGGGAELRFTEKIGAFSDVQWQFNNAGTKDGVAVRFGLRFAF